MRLPRFNLFTTDLGGNPVWLEALADLEAARFRLNQLASASPGEYFVFDLRTKQILVCLMSTNEGLDADSRFASTGTHVGR